MDATTASKFLLLKKEMVSKSKNFEKAYSNILASVKAEGDIIEGLIKLELPAYLVILITELLIEEHERTKTELLTQVAIFTIKKDVN